MEVLSYSVISAISAVYLRYLQYNNNNRFLQRFSPLKETYTLKYFLKRKVLSPFLKTGTAELVLIARGIVFHKTGEATEKKRSPKVLSHVLGTASKFFFAECRLLRLGL